jgi:hypothetical protein
MTMLLGPSKAVLSGTLGNDGENGEGEAPAEATQAATAVEDAVPEADRNGAVAEADVEPAANDDAEPAAEDDDAGPAA